MKAFELVVDFYLRDLSIDLLEERIESVVNHRCRHVGFPGTTFIIQIHPNIAQATSYMKNAHDRRWHFQMPESTQFAMPMALQNMTIEGEDWLRAGLKNSHLQAGMIKDEKRSATGTLVTGMRYGEECKACNNPNMTTDLATLRDEGVKASTQGPENVHIQHLRCCDHDDLDGGWQDARNEASRS
jgi:hypothetical protein